MKATPTPKAPIAAPAAAVKETSTPAPEAKSVEAAEEVRGGGSDYPYCCCLWRRMCLKNLEHTTNTWMFWVQQRLFDRRLREIEAERIHR